MNGTATSYRTESETLHLLWDLKNDITELKEQITDLNSRFAEIVDLKDWYSTAEVAAMMGVTPHTVRERWCNAGRIECDKDPQSGNWRIPGHEYDRLRKGGRPAGL